MCFHILEIKMNWNILLVSFFFFEVKCLISDFKIFKLAGITDA